jgi:molecular chaperone DnaJ
VPRDHYEVLGVGRTAAADQIKSAYRKRAQELHPDRNPDNPEAEAQFKELAVAYEVLSDPAQRAQYDQYGHDGPGNAGFGDIFEAFFGGASPFGGGGSSGRSAGPQAGPDLEAVVEVDLAGAVFGAAEDVTVRTAVACEVCEATGAAPGTDPVVCSNCSGTGQVQRVRQSILGQMVTASACNVCGGSGRHIEQRCDICRGEGRVVTERTYTVEVPAGVDNGSTLRLTGRGAVGPRGGPHGDLYVHVKVEADDRFTRDGNDLIHDLHVTMAQAGLGVDLELGTLDGVEEITVKPGVQSGHLIRLRSLGVPNVRGRGRGDLIVKVIVDTPTDLDEEQAELLRQLAELRGEEVTEPSSGLVGRIRSAFGS